MVRCSCRWWLILLTLSALCIHRGGAGEEFALRLAGLNDPEWIILPADLPPRDPLEDVAELIRPQIDPTQGPRWPDGCKAEYVEHIKSIHADYSSFWERIAPEVRRFVDLDNNGHPELFIISDGLNDTAWGFQHFVAVLKRPEDAAGNISAQWHLAFLKVFDDGPWVGFVPDHKGLRFREFEIAIADLDRNGRPNIIFTTTKLGGSAHARTLHVISMGEDMTLCHHELWSREPIDIIDGQALRPVFVQHDDDEWMPHDSGASVRARGYRKAYYRWNVNDGFVRF